MMKKFFPPTHFYTYLICSILFHFLLPVKQIINPPAANIGWVLIIAGGILNIWADQLFKKSRTTVKPNEKPSKLIDYGPFRISRNPMYLGMAIILLGVGIFLGSVTSFLGALVFVIAMEVYFIPDEERIMIEAFGKQYEQYMLKVRRWI